MRTVIGYTRVSTREQGVSGLGLDAQRERIETWAAARDVRMQWISDAGHTGSDLHRPGLADALALLRAGESSAIVVAKLDRLSRSTHDFTGLMKRAKEERWSLVALDLDIDTGTPNGKFLANVIAAIAEWEADVISLRTRDALAAARARGVRLGRPPLPVTDRLRYAARLRATGLSHAQVAAKLNEEGIPSPAGKRWHPSTVARQIVRLRDMER